LIEDLAPVAPVIEVVDVNSEGEDDHWWIPPVYCHQDHSLDKYSTACVDPVPNYVADV
jgi:hypothetical protein